MCASPAFTMLSRPPRGELSGLVIKITDYVEHGPPPPLQREGASLVVPIIIGFAAPFEIALGREPAKGEAWQSFAAGLTAGPALIRAPGSAACVQIDFTPLGARAFFGGAVSDLAGRMVSLSDLGDPALQRLREALAETADPAARLSLAENFTLARIARGKAASKPVAAAYRAILAQGGRLRIQALADAMGWSRKHLAARFADEIGVSPKTVARLARFAEARRMAQAPGAPGWAGIADASGYADQAHLAREFRALAGLSPTEWSAAPAW
jgi:AraC-like DNA-binding protein